MDIAKEDIDELKEEFSTLSYDLFNINQKIAEITRILGSFEKQLKTIETSSLNSNKHNILPFKALKPVNTSFSTGNEGVPTDRQTDQQTDQHIVKTPPQTLQHISNILQNESKTPSIKPQNESFQHIQHINTDTIQETPAHNSNQQTDQRIIPIQNNLPTHPADTPTDRQTDKQTKNVVYNNKNTLNVVNKEVNNIDNAINLLNSLDSIKKDLRIKFKRLTEQEFLVFSTMYQLDEETGHSTYKSLSEKLNLTESSIRDYLGKIIKKGIPVEKIKINNKMVQLNISSNLKKLATLSTLLQLREI